MKAQRDDNSDRRLKTKIYIAMRLMKWSSIEINGRPLSRKSDTKVEHSLGFLPAYETLGELTKYWGADAPYITVEIIDE